MAKRIVKNIRHNEKMMQILSSYKGMPRFHKACRLVSDEASRLNAKLTYGETVSIASRLLFVCG